ncbi:MAG TPA: hydroxymethylbilane synthase [Candidatus Limnocylindrales bacterium]|nr:hydroxymethylbilane synthase [Candidatus Limnocylindrales bacterium]
MRSIGRLRLGTRGSLLARTQSGLVAEALAALGVEVELVEIVTTGDRRPADTTWGEGWFVTSLRDALLGGEIDLAVHSAKDVPIEEVAGLVIAAMPERADPRDALVLHPGAAAAGESGDPLAALARGATVGTDSPRRAGFLRAARPDLRVIPLHGNVDTRLARLDRREADALVLAVAGLARLGRADRISAVLSPDLVPPAPGQGALAVEVRRDDDGVAALVAGLDHAPTHVAVRTERRVLETTGGGCRAPVGALATVRGGTIDLRAGAVDPDGAHLRRVRRSASAPDWARLATDTGRALGRVAVPA